METHFKHLLLRRYLLSFGSLFDNITLTREDNTGDEVYRQVVPLEYGPKERWLTRFTQDPDLTRGVGQIVPRLSYEMSGLSYDGARKLNSLEKLTYVGSSPSDRARLYVGTPYTLGVRLSILTKLQQDGMQIVEQILPYFTPDYPIAVEPLDNYPDLVDVVPITLQSVSQTDNYEGNFETRRIIVWDLDFAMKVYFYGPIRQKARIQKVIVNLYNSNSADLAAPDANTSSPQIAITVVPSVSLSASASPSTEETAVVLGRDAAITTVIEDFGKFAPSLSPSASVSPSASRSPSASVSPSSSTSLSISPSASRSPSASASPSN